MSIDLNGSTALVTGATGGIGQAVARALHARGATVILTGRRAELLEDLRAELGQRAEALVADLTDRADVQRLAQREVDVLVANAGLPAAGKLEGFTGEQIDRAIDVNLRAPIQLSLAMFPGMV